MPTGYKLSLMAGNALVQRFKPLLTLLVQAVCSNQEKRNIFAQKMPRWARPSACWRVLTQARSTTHTTHSQAIAAAVGSLMMRITSSPAMTPASWVAAGHEHGGQKRGQRRDSPSQMATRARSTGRQRQKRQTRVALCF